MATKIAPRKHTVTLRIEGEVERKVLAVSEEDAVAKVKKHFLQEDGQCPKAGSLNAFCWDFPTGWARVHWSELTEEEVEKQEQERDAALKRLLAKEQENNND